MRWIFALALAAAAAGCADMGASSPLACPGCSVGEYGWWRGPVRGCSWFPFATGVAATQAVRGRQFED